VDSATSGAIRFYNGCKRPILRALVFVFCILFILAPILSEAFIIAHADHEHDHDGAHGSCATCAHLAAAEILLKSVSIAPAIAAFAFWYSANVLSIRKPADFHTNFYTLVILKVRLNN
jgi:hypothetical protein